MRKILDWIKRQLDFITIEPFYLEPKDFGMKITTITRQPNGRFAILSNGQIVETYARERDARRGAQRRGLTLA